MDFTYPEDVAAFRKDFGRYLDEIATPELFAEIRSERWGTDRTKAFWRKLGADGYFGMGWPVEYGGAGKSPLYLHAFNYEMSYRRLPIPLVTLNTVAPTLMRIGSEQQKSEYLPRILTGEIEFAIGYTEPEAGTDLASLQTRAVRDGDEYVINGQKVFTSGAHHSDYVWLAVRTDPDAPKHRGISILIVPLDSEGIDITRMDIMSGHPTNITFYNDVRVPISALLGEENQGWRYMTTQLDFERVAISPVPHIERVFDWLRTHVEESDHWGQTLLACVAADLHVLKVMDLKLASMVANGEVPVYEASLLKVISNELRTTLAGEALQIAGTDGLLRHGSQGSLADVAGETLERQLRDSATLLFGGGSNDIQRDIIGFHGLGLPR